MYLSAVHNLYKPHNIFFSFGNYLTNKELTGICISGHNC